MQKKRILCTSAALLAAISLIMPNQGYAKAKKPVLSKKKLTMSVGESKTLKVKNTKKKVKWSSGKKSVASVSKKGRVKAKKKGTAVITAKVAKTKLKCRVTVKAKASKKNTAQNTKPSNPSNNTPNQNILGGIYDPQQCNALEKVVMRIVTKSNSYISTVKSDKIAAFVHELNQ